MYPNNYRGPRQNRRPQYPQNYSYYPQPRLQYDPVYAQQAPAPMEDPGANFPFKIGEKVIHKFTKDELFVIRYGREQLECRKPDLTSGWFYVDELESPNNT